MAKQRTIKRGTCGFCLTNNGHRHEHCPGTIQRAQAGKDWTCWCSENGHPDVLPEAPVVRVEQVGDLSDEGDAPTRVREARTTEPEGNDVGPEVQGPTKAHGATGERCGHQTSKGPCKRRAGHTRGHDAR